MNLGHKLNCVNKCFTVTTAFYVVSTVLKLRFDNKMLSLSILYVDTLSKRNLYFKQLGYNVNNIVVLVIIKQENMRFY